MPRIHTTGYVDGESPARRANPAWARCSHEHGGRVSWQATSAAGADAKIIAGKAITQLTQAGGDGGDLVAIELRTEELDVNGEFAYVAAIVTVGNAASELSAVLLLGCTNYAPVPVTAWTEIVD